VAASQNRSTPGIFTEIFNIKLASHRQMAKSSDRSKSPRRNHFGQPMTAALVAPAVVKEAVDGGSFPIFMRLHAVMSV
jgi:hypothetical protein